jgi:hypothetical protein
MSVLMRAVADKEIANGANRQQLGECLLASNLCDDSILAEFNVRNYRLAAGH